MIQFKLEMPIIKRRPTFEMEDRLVLEKVNYDTNEITIYGKTYPLKIHVSVLWTHKILVNYYLRKKKKLENSYYFPTI